MKPVKSPFLSQTHHILCCCGSRLLRVVLLSFYGFRLLRIHIGAKNPNPNLRWNRGKIRTEDGWQGSQVLLGFLLNSSPSSSQVKAAYKKKAWETHPDRFPLSQRSLAEFNFKPVGIHFHFHHISSAYFHSLLCFADFRSLQSASGNFYLMIPCHFLQLEAAIYVINQYSFGL